MRSLQFSLRSNLLIILSVFFFLSGCASEKAYENYSNAFKASSADYYEAAKLPLLDLKLPAPDGKEYHLVVNREIKPVDLKQIKDSEWVAPVSGAINTLGVVGGIVAVSKGAGTRTETVGGDKVSGDSIKPVTTTTTTEVVFPPEAPAI